MNNIIGERIKTLRTKAGLSQEELAEKVEVKRPMISYYENGTRKPDLETLSLLAHYLSTSTDYILGISGNRQPEYKDLDILLGLTDEAIEKLKTFDLHTDVLSLLITNPTFERLITQYDYEYEDIDELLKESIDLDTEYSYRRYLLAKDIIEMIKEIEIQKIEYYYPKEAIAEMKKLKDNHDKTMLSIQKAQKQYIADLWERYSDSTERAEE